MMRAQKQATFRRIEELGFVVPTRTFFQNEERRYTNIFSDDPYYSSRLAAPRELLQNSSDAGTDRLDVVTVNLMDDHSLVTLGLQLESLMLFVCVSDSGRWCGVDEEVTYAKCLKYFLSMNGSSKDQAASAARARQDGGFGVGRLVILFCAPFWAFTARHLLVIGHFNHFRVLCRRCFGSVSSAECQACGLRERATPTGTTFLVHYKHFYGPSYLDTYAHLLLFGYYKFCQVKFPVRINQVPVVPFPKGHTIHRGQLFVVSSIDFGIHETEVLTYYGCTYTKRFKSGLYLVRTAKGIPMFTKIIHSRETEANMFFVDLHESVTFNDFDQSRQALQNAVGAEFSAYMAERSNVSGSRDIDHDFEQHVSGVDPLLESVQAAASARTVKSRRLAVAAAPAASGVVEAAKPRHLPQIQPDPDQVADLQDLWPGFLNCIMKFTGGSTVEGVPAVWRPGQSWQQIYLLILWTETLNLIVPSHLVDQFHVGLLFSTDAEAMMQRRKDHTCVFYLDPIHLQTEVMDLEDSKTEDADEKLRRTFDVSRRENLVAAVISNATHEVTHLAHHGHNAAFASAMNTVFTQTLKNRVFDQLVQRDDIFRRAAKRLFVAKSPQQLQAAAERKKRKASAVTEDEA